MKKSKNKISVSQAVKFKEIRTKYFDFENDYFLKKVSKDSVLMKVAKKNKKGQPTGYFKYIIWANDTANAIKIKDDIEREINNAILEANDKKFSLNRKIKIVNSSKLLLNKSDAWQLQENHIFGIEGLKNWFNSKIDEINSEVDSFDDLFDNYLSDDPTLENSSFSVRKDTGIRYSLTGYDIEDQKRFKECLGDIFITVSHHKPEILEQPPRKTREDKLDYFQNIYNYKIYIEK